MAGELHSYSAEKGQHMSIAALENSLEIIVLSNECYFKQQKDNQQVTLHKSRQLHKKERTKVILKQSAHWCTISSLAASLSILR